MLKKDLLQVTVQDGELNLARPRDDVVGIDLFLAGRSTSKESHREGSCCPSCDILWFLVEPFIFMLSHLVKYYHYPVRTTSTLSS